MAAQLLTLTPDDVGAVRALTPVGFFDFPWERAPRLFNVEKANQAALEETAQRFRPDVIRVEHGRHRQSADYQRRHICPVVTDVAITGYSAVSRATPS